MSDSILLALATPLSIIIAIILGVLTLWQDRRLARRSHTLDVLLARFSGNELSTHLRALSKWELGAKKLPDGSKDVFEIREALNLYEFIAAAARQGILDTPLIYETRGGAMMRTFDLFYPYIKKRREILENDKIWEHYEWFVENKVRPLRNRG